MIGQEPSGSFFISYHHNIQEVYLSVLLAQLATSVIHDAPADECEGWFEGEQFIYRTGDWINRKRDQVGQLVGKQRPPAVTFTAQSGTGGGIEFKRRVLINSVLRPLNADVACPTRHQAPY